MRRIFSVDMRRLNMAGCGVAVTDAHPRVSVAADIVFKNSGGYGAVREICELILQSMKP